MEFDLDLFRFAWQIQKTEYWISKIVLQIVKNCILSEVCMIKKKRLIVLFTSDVM